ncbi:transposase [Thioflavicoccus mobilis]|uniref:transposase n=1 Tax=Thioflavicoccus mobilis TaxID=80679 RepID=UPI0002F613F0|nr:transposase [Thioflavicoccus mobilis]
MALNRCTDLAGDAAAVSPLHRDAMPHVTILSSYIALLCLGKSDFEAITGFREDPYFGEVLGLDRVPSEGILRQRMDAHAAAYQGVVEAAAIEFLRRSDAQITALENGLVPLDCDVTPFDNSQSKKEGVSRTDKGEDGYAPIAAYLGREGYCVGLELRPGSQHCQNGTPEFLQRVIGRARQLSTAPLLLRLDSGTDAIENIVLVEALNDCDESRAPVHHLIK